MAQISIIAQYWCCAQGKYDDVMVVIEVMTNEYRRYHERAQSTILSITQAFAYLIERALEMYVFLEFFAYIILISDCLSDHRSNRLL